MDKMNILVLTPFGAVEPGAEETLRRVQRPDTRFSLECLEEVFPLPYNTYRYNTMKCTDGAVERIILAESEGYDAVVVSCTYDPGVFEARGVVDIPVIGTLESALLTSLMMGQMFSLVCPGPDQVVVSVLRRMVHTFGLSARCASLRHIGIVARDLYPDVTPVEEVVTLLQEAASRCVDDGAEVIVPGCSIIGAIYTNSLGDEPQNVIGAPIIDPQVVAFKTAEMMVDLHRKVGYPAVSRAGLWRRQPEGEYEDLRDWLKERKSPLQRFDRG